TKMKVLFLVVALHENMLPLPFLITENMWPRGCALDCQRGRHRAVCGSNGRLYKSLCAFQRARCINTQLLAFNGYLKYPKKNYTKCPAAAAFVAECGADGHFLPVQCHNQTRYCWCSMPDGKPVSGTSVLHLMPDCTGQIYLLQQSSCTLKGNN
uniref:Uncharacterized protein n=1 Tax=Cyclopterus lumpus TaxID=8103 RepID=A0A8C2WP85_CYCLU